MLRITITTRPEGVTVALEGRLAGPWVDELARCWKALTATQDAGSVCVQLEAVTFIDAAGKELLRTMHARRFSADGSARVPNDRRVILRMLRPPPCRGTAR